MVQLSSLNLLEYSSYGEQKFEFQIRTILQHSWAEIEHDLGYKGEFEIPSTAKRTFYRVAALLEQADIEFVKLKSTIAEYETGLSQDIKTNPSQIEINKASLTSFMSQNDNVIIFENDVFVGEYNLVITEFDIEKFAHDKLINRIKKLGVENIKQLEEFYLDNEGLLRESIESIFLKGGHTSVGRGDSVLILINYTFSDRKVQKYYEKIINISSSMKILATNYFKPILSLPNSQQTDLLYKKEAGH